MDVLTPEQRSYCMSRIKGKDTSIEVTVRSLLHRRGWRFRKHVKNLPGRPDIVFGGRKVAVFLDGDFWHGRYLSRWEHKLTPKWRHKIAETRRRDARNFRKLRNEGWTVIRIWQSEIERSPDETIRRVEAFLEPGHKRKINRERGAAARDN